MNLFAALSQPFDPSKISWRVGSTNSDKTKGLALAYIDARDVMNRLDDVLTPSGWQDRYEVHGGKTICYLSIRCENGEWLTKADAAGDSAVEAEKGAISDAFKRAAVKWGIGRYLYDIESPWVELTNGKYISKTEQQRLASYLKPADKTKAAEMWVNDALRIIPRLKEAYPELYLTFKTML